MSTRIAIKASSIWSRELLLVFIIAGVLTIAYIGLIFLSGGKITILVLFPLAAILLCVISSYELALVTLVISLFVNYHAFGFSAGLWFSLPLGLSLILKYVNIKWDEFSNPLTISILIYGTCIVPSFLNADKPLVSLFMLFNVIAFLIVLYSVAIGLRTYANLRIIIAVYLGFVLLNSLDIFRLSLVSNKRPFGFAGIMFVDYAGLGICVTAALSIISHRKARFFFLLLSMLIAIALILTQTRSIWLATLITLAILVGYLFFHPEVAGFSRRQLILMTSVGTLVLFAVIFIFTNTQVQRRTMELTDTPAYGIDETGRVENSLVSRLLIWDTALNAFLAHPYFGIGVYAFPYSSQYYSTIPKILYKRYVENCSPHQTHLAVLAETGIVGAVGFIILMVTIVRCAFKTIWQASETQGRKYALVGATGVTYCMVSMVFTDAWLWGQGIVLLGLVLGLMLANRRICVMQETE